MDLDCDEKNYPKYLERWSYRSLQQMAKAMSLPSNVKKIHLIQLIHAKKFRSSDEVESLAKRIRLLRKQVAVARKAIKYYPRRSLQQSTEISSTSNTNSPPLTLTPKRCSRVVVRYSPEARPARCTRSVRHGDIFHRNINATHRKSDRVLRSYNAVKKPNYVVNNTLIGIIKSSNTEQRSERRLSIVNDDNYRKVDVATHVTRRTGQSMGGELNPVTVKRVKTSPQPSKRQRTVSGIYPLDTADVKVPNVIVRRPDGTLSKINAIIQKPFTQHNRHMRYGNLVLCKSDASTVCWKKPSICFENSVNVHGLLYPLNNRNIRNQLAPAVQTTSMQNLTGLSEILKIDDTQYKDKQFTVKIDDTQFKDKQFTVKIDDTQYKDKQFTEYYHKKIRAEQIRQKSHVYRDDSQVYSTMGESPVFKNTNENQVYKNMNEIQVYRTMGENQVYKNTKENQVHKNMNEVEVYRTIGENQVYKNIDENQVHINTNEIQVLKAIGESQVYKTIGQSQVYKTFDGSQLYKNMSECQVFRNTDACPPCEGAEGLPRIGDVFSQCHALYRNVSQPIYVHVGSEPQITEPLQTEPSTGGVLEHLYNLKNVLVPAGLAPMPSAASTRCVYTTPLITTAKAQPSIAPVSDEFNVVSLRDVTCGVELDHMPRVHEFFRNFTCDEDAISLGSVSQQDANVTIPEMVEDALELISQDGDYMERIEMDVRMQCILCTWAGPKIILEYHIRKEHPSEIHEASGREWSATFCLGALMNTRAWRSRLVARGECLYALSAACRVPGRLEATLSNVSDTDSPQMGRITTYNKVTGEPYTWEGEILPLTPTMPYENDNCCLTLDLSSMDLLPNSANLKLVNGELVAKSTNKVIVGQPELDNIFIVFTVHILN